MFALSYSEPVYNISREQSSLFLFLCDNLSNFISQHAHRAQYFILSSSVSRKVGTLLKVKEKHVCLGEFAVLYAVKRMAKLTFHCVQLHFASSVSASR